MPRKRKARQLFRRSRKDLPPGSAERLSVEGFVNSFNVEDPIELFRDMPDFEQIAQDPKAQERLRQSFNRVREAIKNTIWALEDLINPPDEAKDSREERIRKLQKAAGEVNRLPTMWLRYSIGVRNDGFIDNTGAAFQFDKAAKDEYILGSAAIEICSKIEQFKAKLARQREHFSIGVCRLQGCERFYVKDRVTQRYCSQYHKNLDWKRKHLYPKTQKIPS